MKRSLLFISALLTASAASAQIVVHSGDVASPVKVIYQSRDEVMTSGAIVGSAGASQTWNMTALTTSGVDTLTFISYSWAPDASFSSSNLVAKQGSGNNYIYMNNSIPSLTALGSKGETDFGCGTTTVRQINTPAETFMTWPATMGTNFNSNFRQQLPPTYLGCDPGFGVTVDSVAQDAGVMKTVVVDAWGSLTTPLGTFNVIRAKETVIRRDTTHVMIFGAWDPVAGLPLISADSTTGYSWWANGVGFPLVSMKLDSIGDLKEALWLQAIPATGINEYSAALVNTYPNPATDNITFDVAADKVAMIEVYDATGRLVAVHAVTHDLMSISTAELSNGIYSYALISREKTILNRGKFSVAK